MFDFITNVLNDTKQYDCYTGIEAQRSKLKANTQVIVVEDFGAGSTVIKSNQRKVKDIANSSLKPPKFARLLFRMVQYYQPAIIVELGTSLGITSAYLSFGNKDAKLYTCEGASGIADIAQQTFGALHVNNVELIRGDFGNTLPELLSRIKTPGFVFLDGNHRKAPTLQYFRELLAHSCATTIFVFDDIHWSPEMESAWSVIQNDPAVRLTIDLFFIGVVFINPDFKVKQHFTIRF